MMFVIYLYFKVGLGFFALWFWFICSRNTEEVSKTLKEGGVVPFIMVSAIFISIWPVIIFWMAFAFFRALFWGRR